LQFPVVLIPWMDWTLGPNQRDLLWVTSGESPYDELGMIPVKPTKALVNTSFSRQYEDELTSNYIDNLNLMYVAMTRAEEQLYIFCEDSKTAAIKNAGHIVKNAARRATVLKPVVTHTETPTLAGASAPHDDLPKDDSEETFEAGEL